MHADLLRARSLGYLLLRDRVPEGARLDPPFLRYDASWTDAELGGAIERALASAKGPRT